MKYLIVLLLFVLTLPASAQKAKKVKGEFTYYALENESMVEAKRKALEQAKIKALADKFGVSVSENTESRGKIHNGQADENFIIIGGTEVKGEWIETTGEPQYDIRYEGGQLIVTCMVKGKAREIVASSIDFKAKVLCNGIEDKFENTHFKNGDDLYLSFFSPVKGYLAVYLEGEDGQVSCLLPYRCQKDGICPIDANRRYLFFDPKSVPANEMAMVDEYYMTCGDASEYNRVWIIFSPNPFTKASDNAVQENLPRQLSYGDFRTWLSKCRNRDKDMQLKEVGVTVEK